MKTFKNRLREAREERGVSVTELSSRTGKSRQSLTKIELHGYIPKGDTLLLICQALNLEPKEIFYIEESET